MKIADSRNNTDVQEGSAPLILSQRHTSRGQTGSLIVQQESLGLADDLGYITLRRYFEHYDPGCGEWVEYSHTVPIRELIHWLMAHGKLQIRASQDAPPTQAWQAAAQEERRP
ncbi:hypothetical protein [Pseudomonas sp. CCOS 191]|uniref:hypothetical protein n=1 Tax=Pseudomonas sp. CCOS 191 TaxID=1649877 RepID=UPI000624A9AE|nr:hypothetical protein [Pseudomonas sp. CCOS 191]CRI56643.1 hypothetical protein CCOS191_2107 [Pseudomonas sp. CCOS 191]